MRLRHAAQLGPPTQTRSVVRWGSTARERSGVLEHPRVIRDWATGKSIVRNLIFLKFLQNWMFVVTWIHSLAPVFPEFRDVRSGGLTTLCANLMIPVGSVLEIHSIGPGQDYILGASHTRLRSHWERATWCLCPSGVPRLPVSRPAGTEHWTPTPAMLSDLRQLSSYCVNLHFFMFGTFPVSLSIKTGKSYIYLIMQTSRLHEMICKILSA